MLSGCVHHKVESFSEAAIARLNDSNSRTKYKNAKLIITNVTIINYLTKQLYTPEFHNTAAFPHKTKITHNMSTSRKIYTYLSLDIRQLAFLSTISLISLYTM